MKRLAQFITALVISGMTLFAYAASPAHLYFYSNDTQVPQLQVNMSSDVSSMGNSNEQRCYAEQLGANAVQNYTVNNPCEITELNLRVISGAGYQLCPINLSATITPNSNGQSPCLQLTPPETMSVTVLQATANSTTVQLVCGAYQFNVKSACTFINN